VLEENGETMDATEVQWMMPSHMSPHKVLNHQRIMNTLPKSENANMTKNQLSILSKVLQMLNHKTMVLYKPLLLNNPSPLVLKLILNNSNYIPPVFSIMKVAELTLITVF